MNATNGCSLVLAGSGPDSRIASPRACAPGTSPFGTPGTAPAEAPLARETVIRERSRVAIVCSEVIRVVLALALLAAAVLA